MKIDNGIENLNNSLLNEVVFIERQCLQSKMNTCKRDNKIITSQLVRKKSDMLP